MVAAHQEPLQPVTPNEVLEQLASMRDRDQAARAIVRSRLVHRLLTGEAPEVVPSERFMGYFRHVEDDIEGPDSVSKLLIRHGTHPAVEMLDSMLDSVENSQDRTELILAQRAAAVMIHEVEQHGL